MRVTGISTGGTRAGRRGIAMRGLAIGLAGVLSLGACGDDDEATTTTTTAETTTSSAETTTTEDAPEASFADYCAAVGEVGDALPTEEQIDQILEVAPEEIAENLAVVLGAIREDPDAAFDDPAVTENFAPIEAFEAENCGQRQTEEVDPDAARIEVTATEYAFEVSDATAGRVSFVMTNEGDEAHEMAIARLLGDTNLAEALAAEDPEAEGLIESVGFAGPVNSGGTAVINVEDLAPGTYAIACFLPLGNDTTHADEGMATQFTVG